MRFETYLGRSVHALWATSYSFDLRLFDQYLLRRLAQSTLNAVVLVDHDKLASVWERLEAHEHYLVRQAGRRYLLRGVRPRGGGAFHPKTYLLGDGDSATLLVGSGNLTRDGIDHGREVFTTFTARRDEDLPTMRAWGRWVGQLVQRQQDELLQDRWVALRKSCPWIVGTTDGSELLSNEVQPLLDQLVQRIHGQVRELHVAAPFFDPSAEALGQVISLCQPQKITVYVGAQASVNGQALKAVLAHLPMVRVRRFEPAMFVHAKLIGVVKTDGSGLLLSGSPNLSQAALTRTESDLGGNCEVAVLRAGTPEQVRELFASSGLDLIDVSLEALEDLEFSDDHPTLSRPFRLRSARWLADGRIQLDVSPKPSPDLVWLDCPGAGLVAALSADLSTAEPLVDHEPIPILVRLLDDNGHRVSNGVVIDDPAALRDALEGSTKTSSRRPPELEGIEETPLIRLVRWAHEKFIFDPDQTSAFQRAEQAAREDATVEEPTDFWKRYAEEELQYDPRTRSYQPLTVGNATVRPVDDLLRELERLLHAAPKTDAHRLLHVLTGNAAAQGEEGTGTPWSMEARYRIRAYHLLLRWSTAVGDPRHALIAATAPVTNYETLIALIFLAWANDALELHQLRRVLLTLLNAFIGPALGHGFLGRCSTAQQEHALGALEPPFVSIAAGLVYAAITTPGWTEDIYDWQPALQRGVELGVILPGQLTASVVLHLTGKDADQVTIDHALAQRLDWVDDLTWCKRLAAELDLANLSLEAFHNPKVPLAARIGGHIDFLTDPRVLTVARRAVGFKHSPAIAVIVGNDRFIFAPGISARANIGGPGGQSYETDSPADAARLRAVEEQGGALIDLFRISPPAKAA